MLIVRPITKEDLPEVLAILNREILEGTAHFGTDPMSMDDILREFEHAGNYPWLGATEDGVVAGFARASPWKSRGAYARTCEVGVYVRPDYHRRGIAAAIYGQFLPELEARGFKTLLGGIALPNPASIRLHEKFGFSYVGTFPKVGWKFGKWRDVGYWALTFAEN